MPSEYMPSAGQDANKIRRSSWIEADAALGIICAHATA
jgi:hypothetical protein